MRVRCDRCDELHDLSQIEPSFRHPDAYLAVADAEREGRTQASNDFCLVRGASGVPDRWFVRSLLRVPVPEAASDCCWGIWSEVSGADFARIQLLWNDAEQAKHPGFDARLANDVDGYARTSGLRGRLRLVDPDKIPFFTFASDVRHLLADEARQGVSPARVLEWLEPWLHRRV